MNFVRRRLTARACSAVACGVALLALSGCAEEKLFDATGVVEEILRDEGQVVIAHEDIPDLMPAMTMNFSVARRSLLDPLEAGQRVRFKLLFNGRDYRIVEIRVDGNAPIDQGGARGRGTLASGVAPDFTLTDQNGEAFSLADLRGKRVLLDFIFTHCPGPCPALTGLHVDVQRSIPEDARSRVHFVSITIDPRRDSPEVLAAYAKARGVDFANWSFLGGAPEEVAAVIKAYAVGTVIKPDGEIDHQIVTYLIDEEGRVITHLFGSSQEPADLVARLAAPSAADG